MHTEKLVNKEKDSIEKTNTPKNSRNRVGVQSEMHDIPLCLSSNSVRRLTHFPPMPSFD